MRTTLSGCLGLSDDGQHKGTSKLLVIVPHATPHGTMRVLEKLCMLLPEALKMRAINDTMVLIVRCGSCQVLKVWVMGDKGHLSALSWWFHQPFWL